MKNGNIEIRSAEIEHLNAILEIADQQFGNNYLSKRELESYLIDSKYQILIALQDDILLAYSLIKICFVKELLAFIKAEKKKIERLLKNHQPIACRMQIAVSDAYMGLGVGKKLTNKSLELSKKYAKSSLSVVWKNGRENGMDNILLDNGFVKAFEEKNYWKEDSLIKNYKCKNCGLPPCTCSAVIYYQVWDS
ncbi:MAG: hypothetical protein U9R42_03905 [Bacteroidota bacterium]|nr:hypothetical protein [Bacteroidota bacterium]